MPREGDPAGRWGAPECPSTHSHPDLWPRAGGRRPRARGRTPLGGTRAHLTHPAPGCSHGLLGPERSPLQGRMGGGSSTLRAPLTGPWDSLRPWPAALHLPEQHSLKASAPPGPSSHALVVFAICDSPRFTAMLCPTHRHCAGRSQLPIALCNTGTAVPRQEAA